MKRISVFDTGKGIAVLGMIIAHTFEGGICEWDHDIEMTCLRSISNWVIILLSPFSLILMMGLFFTYITSITCGLSVINKEKYGHWVVAQYILYRIIFAIVLKFMEILITTWWKYYDVFNTMYLQVPKAPIPRYSHTLDSVGACGWIVPLAVYLVRRLPEYHGSLLQVCILCSSALVLLIFYQPIASSAMKIAIFFEEHNLNGVSIIFSKIGSGPFMLAQCIPFGLVGGAIAIMLSENLTCQILWRFSIIFSSITTLLALLLILRVKDFWYQTLQENKPPSVRLMELVVETNIIVLGVYLCEDPRRSPEKRGVLIRKGTFLRRISVLSLTAFIFEQYICTITMKWFRIFFGKAVDIETKQYLWNVPLSMLYMVATTTVELGIIRVWEMGSFRLSCEHFIAIILGFLFNRQSYNRLDYQRIIYGPNIFYSTEAEERRTIIRSRSKSL